MDDFWIRQAKNGKIHGPISAGRLKKLAASGDLLPDDKIGKNADGPWHSAKTVKGLFESIVQSVSTPKKESDESQEVNSKIIRCLDCDGILSIRAGTCPHCGAPARNTADDTPQDNSTDNLVACRHCHQNISPNASQCPNCGAPSVQAELAAKELHSAGTQMQIYAVFAFIFIYLWWNADWIGKSLFKLMNP